ncbi:MAG: DegV family protein [Clostridia bacterium]|nr:DegV family protein [Clostridia bacterium]
MSIKIIVDSTTDIPEYLRNEFIIVPLTIRFGEEEYTDGVNLSRTQFYEKLIESDVLPQTSQVSPATFEEYFRKVTDNGDSAVVLTISSNLSGTYQSATIAAEEFPGKIYVVDTKSAAIGASILAQMALHLRDEGLSVHEIAEKLCEERNNLRVIALLDTLEYLKKGGRISSTVAFAGGLLAIKPVVCIEDGAVKMLGKARGSKQGNNLLVKIIEESGGVDFSRPVLLGYTGLSDVMLRKYIEDSKHLWEECGREPDSTLIGSVVGTHVGPGAVAAAFFKEN